MITFTNVTFKYQNKIILDKISFEINQGDFICVYGPNGAGKSTLAYLLLGYLKPTSGTIFLDNKPLQNKEDANELFKKVGIVFQNIDDQFVYEKVNRDLAFSLENKQATYEEMDKLVHKYSKEFGIEDLLDQSIHHLSGGEKQKVALTSFAIDSKEVIVFDESFAMLDPNSLEIFWNVLEVLKKQGKTVILISHNYLIPYHFDWKFFYLDKGISIFEKPSDFLNFIYPQIKNSYFTKILDFQKKNQLELSLDPKTIASQIGNNYETDN